MTSSKNSLVLALALLITQTAIAAHDIHCLDGEHEQTCTIYLTQDHNAECNSNQDQLERTLYGEKSDTVTTRISPSTSISLYFSRAPPQHV